MSQGRDGAGRDCRRHTDARPRVASEVKREASELLTDRAYPLVRGAYVHNFTCRRVSVSPEARRSHLLVARFLEMTVIGSVHRNESLSVRLSSWS